MRITSSAAGYPRMQGNPPGIPAHHFQDHNPVVGLGGGMELLQGVGGGIDSGHKAEGQVGAAKIVINGFGDPRSPAALFR